MMRLKSLPAAVAVATIAGCVPLAEQRRPGTCEGLVCASPAPARRSVRPTPVPNDPARTRRPAPALEPLPAIALPSAPAARRAAVKAFVGRFVRAESVDGAFVEARLVALESDETLRFGLGVSWPLSALASIADLTPAAPAREAKEKEDGVVAALEPVDVASLASPFDAEPLLLPYIGQEVRVVLRDGRVVEGTLTSIRAARLVFLEGEPVDLADVARVMHRSVRDAPPDWWDRDA